jgi:hypothetical protein
VETGPDSLERTKSHELEPKQPANIPDVLEHVLQRVDKKSEESVQAEPKPPHDAKTVLTRDDVKYLFSGAPHFMLEKGRHNHWYPHAIFPWDENVQTIQDLWDREPLRHESFTLSTLHAHLPVPDPTLSQTTGWAYKDGVKRATFDIGLFEVPNMLAISGKEPGCIGFRHFLELPMEDAVRYREASPKPAVDPELLARMPLSQAFEALDHSRDAYSECNQEVVLDRHKLICEGPQAWKRIGVRDVHIKDIVERLQEIVTLRSEVLQEGKTITILDKESPEALHNKLYTKFLHPATKFLKHSGPEDLKAQIEVLTQVLAVKGAWFDFSLVEWRLRAGQILWELPPHADGDGINQKPASVERPSDSVTSQLQQGLERKWLLLQVLLASELIARLDAVVRVGILQNSKDIVITAEEVQRLDKLRHGKVNWDLIMSRRFADNLVVQYLSKPASPPSSPLPAREQSKSAASDTKTPRKGGFPMRFASFRHHPHTTVAAGPVSESAWDCIVTPRRSERQLQGLLVFANSISWPGRVQVEKTIRGQLQKHAETKALASEAAPFAPVRNEQPRVLGSREMYCKSLSRRLVVLHQPSEHVVKDGEAGPDVGGWLSRSWLAGFVLPGESISHLLMATVLENDAEALATLGPIANVYGGFQYKGHSWWSGKCIVSRVLAALDKSEACMGWAKLDVVPREEGFGRALENTWFEVDVKQVSTLKQKKKAMRIHQGIRVAIESTPLGQGDISSRTFSVPLDEDAPSRHLIDVKFEGLILSKHKQSQESLKGVFSASQASASFSVTTNSDATSPMTFPLAYNVHFISSYTCRPPRGYVSHHHSQFSMEESSSSSLPPPSAEQESESTLEKTDHEHLAKLHHYHHHQNHPHLPGHPLHHSYKYQYVLLTSLHPDTPAPKTTTTMSDKEQPPCDSPPASGPAEEPVWILDARGSHDKEVLARAWCAAAGTSAIVGRVGRTCLACCVREARAIDVGVVIRVGSYGHL